jgi:hypothetical protein
MTFPDHITADAVTKRAHEDGHQSQTLTPIDMSQRLDSSRNAASAASIDRLVAVRDRARP